VVSALLPGYRIRAAREADIPVLRRFISAEAREAEHRSPAAATVTRGVSQAVRGAVPRYWVVMPTGSKTVVACISVFSEWSDWHAAPYWWIQSLYVRKAERGRGLATAMVRFLETAAIEAGVVEIRLYAHRDNRAAMMFYRQVGFRRTPYMVVAREVPQRPVCRAPVVFRTP